ncbi:MAG: peptidoglycan-binding protein, partial [Oricola sp.]|nr:peptidoglycan-binding protein [Oricola sp.]
MLPGAQSWNPLSTQAQYVSALHASRRTFRKFGLDNPLRLAHFIGQGLIETGFLQHKSENLGYTVDGLLKVFPKHFSDRNDALRYERQPQLIANRVYGSRMGNGDESSGDGWRYRGRGFFQLTGKENYGRFGELAGVDLVRDPDILIRDLRKSILVAAAYFSRTGLIEHADRDNASAVSRGVNLGNPKSFRQAHREADRVLWTRKVYASLRDRSDEALPHDVSRGEGGLDVGAVSQRVRDLQHKLNMLGYRAGAEDGVFAQATRRAVVLFQEEYGLRATGVVDAKTAALIEEALEDLRHAPAIVPASSAGATPAAAANRKAGSAGAVAAGIGVAAATNGNNAVQEIDAVGIVPRLKPANIPAESMAPAQSAPGEGITVSTAEAFPESVLKAVNADMLVAGALIAAIILGVLVFRGSRRRAPDPLAPIQRRFRPFRYLTVALWIVASAAVNLLGLSSLAAEFGWIPAPDWKPPLDEVQEV